MKPIVGGLTPIEFLLRLFGNLSTNEGFALGILAHLCTVELVSESHFGCYSGSLVGGCAMMIVIIDSITLDYFQLSRVVFDCQDCRRTIQPSFNTFIAQVEAACPSHM